MDNEDLMEAVLAYTSRHALEVRELLGSGIHGIVHVVESKTDPGRRAVKLYRDSNAYCVKRWCTNDSPREELMQS